MRSSGIRGATGWYGLRRCRVHRDGLAFEQPALRGHLQDKGEHRPEHLLGQPLACIGHARMIGRPLAQLDTQEGANERLSAHCHAIARCESSPSKYAMNSIRKYTPGGIDGRPCAA